MDRKLPVFLALIVVIASILACSLVTGEESFTNLRTATDSDGANVTSVFSPGDVFFAVGDLANAPAGTVVEAKWVAVDVGGYNPGELIYEQTINDFTENSFTGTIYFQLSNDGGWPAGEYKVDVYLDGAFIESMAFSVR